MKKKFVVRANTVLIAVMAMVLMLGAGLGKVHGETTLFQQSRTDTFARLGNVSKPDKPMKIGVVLVTLSNPFWVSMKEGYEQAGKDLGVQIDIQAAPQENSVIAQLNLLENMVAKGYDAIVAHTITGENLIPGLVKSTKKGIITIVETRVDKKAAREAGANPIFIEMVNFYVQGKMGGQYIARKLKKEGGGKVAIIEGLPGAPRSEVKMAPTFCRAPSSLLPDRVGLSLLRRIKARLSMPGFLFSPAVPGYRKSFPVSWVTASSPRVRKFSSLARHTATRDSSRPLFQPGSGGRTSCMAYRISRIVA